jgi:hypothetical protein
VYDPLYSDAGVIPWSPGIISWVEFIDEDTATFEVVYTPDETVIQRLCDKYGLNAEKVLELVRNRNELIRGFTFRVNVMKEKGFA